MNTFRLAHGLGLAAFGFISFSATAAGQCVELASIDSNGIQGNSDCTLAAISSDGRFVAFVSNATNLVTGDTNGISDIFVHDRVTGLTERVSVDSSGAQSNDSSYDPTLSPDGQVVAFSSHASNLVAGDTNGYLDVFVHDRITGLTERVSVDSSGAQSDGNSGVAAISADGRIVAFESVASNLVAGDTNGTWDVFVHDRITGLTERVSVDSSGAEANRDVGGAAISADGAVVAFTSEASNLVVGDMNGTLDVFVHDLTTGLTERVSVDSAGAEANDSSYSEQISADGEVVVFQSAASNLVQGDTNSCYDIFVHDRATGRTERVSVDSSGAQASNYSRSAAISADGGVVAFTSDADNLVPGDTNYVADVFSRDRIAGTTTVVSANCIGDFGDGWYSDSPSLSSDGRLVAFESSARNLVGGATSGTTEVFVNDLSVPPVDAFWASYGSGFPGTLGTPSLTASADPVFGTTITIDLSDSRGIWTPGIILLGLSPGSIPTSAGGTLLVDPILLIVIVAVPPFGLAIPFDVPSDPALCCLSIYLQALELDPGAQFELSFTPGLQLAFGR